MVRGFGLHSTGSERNPGAGSYEQGIGPLRYINDDEFLSKMCTSQIPLKDSASRSEGVTYSKPIAAHISYAVQAGNEAIYFQQLSLISPTASAEPSQTSSARAAPRQ
jgi:hypothetical protein